MSDLDYRGVPYPDIRDTYTDFFRSGKYKIALLGLPPIVGATNAGINIVESLQEGSTNAIGGDLPFVGESIRGAGTLGGINQQLPYVGSDFFGVGGATLGILLLVPLAVHLYREIRGKLGI